MNLDVEDAVAMRLVNWRLRGVMSRGGAVVVNIRAVAPGSPVQQVMLVVAPDQHVVATAAKQEVSPRAAIECVVAGTAVKAVVPCTPVQRVGTVPATKVIVAVTAIERHRLGKVRGHQQITPSSAIDDDATDGCGVKVARLVALHNDNAVVRRVMMIGMRNGDLRHTNVIRCVGSRYGQYTVGCQDSREQAA